MSKLEIGLGLLLMERLSLLMLEVISPIAKQLSLEQMEKDSRLGFNNTFLSQQVVQKLLHITLSIWLKFKKILEPQKLISEMEISPWPEVTLPILSISFSDQSHPIMSQYHLISSLFELIIILHPISLRVYSFNTP